MNGLIVKTFGFAALGAVIGLCLAGPAGAVAGIKIGASTGLSS